MKTLTATLTLLLGLLLGTVPAAAQTVSFTVGNESATTGSSVTVPVTVADFTDVTSAQFTLNWDPTALSLNSTGNYNLTGLSGGSFGNPDDGTLTVSWFDPDAVGKSVNDGTALFTITFDAVAQNAQTASIAFVDSPTPPEVSVDFSVVPFQGTDGGVNVSAPPGNNPPAITNPGDQSSTEGDAVSLQVQASDPDTPLSYSATGLPGGLSIEAATGEISGTLAGDAATNSPYNVEVTVTDDGTPPESATTSFEWVVTEASQPTGTVTFTAGSESGPAGGQVTVPVTVEDFTDVTGVQFTLEWDPAVLEFASLGDFGVAGISGGVFGDPSETGTPGTLTFAWDDPDGTGKSLNDGTTLFSVTFDAVGAANASTALAFTDSPTPQEISSGTAVLTFASNDGTVTVTPPPAMSVTPASLDFGAVETGNAPTETVTVESTGGSALTITAMSVTGSGAFTQTNDCPAALAPGSDCAVTVTFAPQSAGDKTATLTLSSNAGDEDVALSGSATAPATTPGIAVDPITLDFGPVETDNSATEAVTVESTGDADLQVNDVTIGGVDASAFSVTGNTCSGALSPGSVCEIEVEFAPSVVGDSDAQLAISSNAGAQNVSLTGMGQAPPPPTTDDEVTVQVEDASVPTGGSVTVDVVVEEFINVTGTQFSLTWDPSLLDLTSVNSGDLPGVTGGSVSNLGSVFGAPASGVLTFAWDDVDGVGKTLPDESVIFSLTFDAVGPGDTNADVSLSDTPTDQLVFVDFAEAVFVPVNGTVEILSQVSVSGTVSYYDGLPIAGALLTLDGPASQTTTTDGDGGFGFMATVGDDYELSASMPGDAPSTNSVNVNDLSLTRRHILNIAPITSPYKMNAGNVDGNDGVDINDISLMRQFILGLTSTFNGGLWGCPAAGTPTLDPLGYETEYAFTPLADGQSGQDFFCFHKGDVDGSWDPTPKTAAPLLAKASGSSPLALSVEGQPASAGEVVVLLRSDRFENIGGYQFTMEWDPEALAFKGVEQFGVEGLSGQNFGTHRTDDGLLSTVWTDPAGRGHTLPDEHVLFAVRFQSLGDAASTVSLSSRLTPAVAHRGDASLTPVVVAGTAGTVQPAPLPDAFTLGGNYPNPFTHGTRISFDLPEAAIVTVEVYDMLGRHIYAREEQVAAGAGRSLQLSGIPLPSGSYFYRLRAEMSGTTAVKTGRFSVVR